MYRYFLAGYYVEHEAMGYEIEIYKEGGLERFYPHELDYVVRHEDVELLNGEFKGCVRVEVYIIHDKPKIPDELIPRRIKFRLAENLLQVFYLNLEKINDMCEMFLGCGKFLGFNWCPEADEPFARTGEVISTTRMFANCDSLMSVDMSRFNTKNVKNMDYMFQNCLSLTKLNISHYGDVKYEWDTSNVTNMTSMFEGCASVEWLPVDVFKMMSVEYTDRMFKSCISLRNIKFNDHSELMLDYHFPYRHLKNTNEMFENCKNLESIDISHFDISHITAYHDEKSDEFISEMRDMFKDCRSLESIHLENLCTYEREHDSELVFRTFFETLRSGAPNLKYIRIPHFNNRGDLEYNTEEDISGLFENLTELIEVDLSEWKTKNVTDMSRMFKGCAKLESINIDGWDLSRVIYADSMFEDCNSMSSIMLEDKPFEKIASANQMFKNCSNLMELRFNDGCIFESLAAANEMFYGCENMNSLEIPNFDVRRIGASFIMSGMEVETDMLDMFANCRRLETLKLNNFKIDNEVSIPSDIPVGTKTEFGDYRFEYFFLCLHAGAPCLKHIEMRDFDNPQLTSMKGMFRHFNNVESIDLSWCSTENITDMSEMFYGCSSLGELELTSFNTSKVKTMAGMFANCNNLYDLNISSFDTSEVTNMSNMFNGCSKLYILNLSSFNTRRVTTMEGMFQDTESLKQCYMDGFNYENVETLSHLFYNSGIEQIPSSDYRTSYKVVDISYMFTFCSNLTSVYNVQRLDLNTGHVENMCGMFWGCESLGSIDLHNFNTSNVRNMSYMFKGCKRLLSAPDVSNFNTDNTRTFESMFEGCESIGELDLSNFRVNRGVIYRNMFKDCKNLETVDISGLTGRAVDSNAADRMFEGCEKLRYIDMSNFRYDDGNFYDSGKVFVNVGINTSNNILNVGMLYIKNPGICAKYAEKINSQVSKNVKRINIYVQEANVDECRSILGDDIYDRVRFIEYGKGVERVDLPISIPAGRRLYWDSSAREYYIDYFEGWPDHEQNTGIHEKIKIPAYSITMYLDFNPYPPYVNGEYDVEYVKVQIPMKEKIEEESDK